MKILSIIIFTILFSYKSISQIGIGTTNPDPSAILDVQSTTKGFLPPRMTFSQRKSILNPVEGLMVYCTDCCDEHGGLSFYKGSKWETLGLLGCTYIDADNDGIENSIDVDDDNDGILDVNETIEVDLASNPSFENLLVSIASNSFVITDASNVPNWETTAPTNEIEIWRNSQGGFDAYEGQYFVELNAYVSASIYQDINTSEGDILHWQVAHRGRSGVDTFSLNIGPTTGTIEVAKYGTGNSAWSLYSGEYIIPTGQSITRLEFKSIHSTGGSSSGNFIDAFSLKIEDPDTDNDGLINSIDLDSDNDGIPDNVESQTTSGYVDLGISIEADGSITSYGATGIISYPNNDADLIPDFLDSDSDGDGISDANESGFIFTNIDTDKDGLHDNADTYPSNHYKDINGKAINESGTNILSNSGGSSEKDYREL